MTTQLEDKSETNDRISKDYPNLDKLYKLCKSFIGQKIQLSASFMGRSIELNNPNVIGDLLEDIFWPLYKETCPDFEEGPKQDSPDFFAANKKYQFEQKAFGHSPGFDISNFTSFVNQISRPGGLEKKVFRTKYLVYKYKIVDNYVIIENFWMLDIWQIPNYNVKYPMSMQLKYKNVWYNIRPGGVESWSDHDKTAKIFIEKILECIDKCGHLENKDALKASIHEQVEEAKTRGFL